MERFFRIYKIEVAASALVLALIFLDTTLAFGRSIGFSGLFIVVGSLALAAGFAGTVARILIHFIRNKLTSRKRKIIHFVLAFLLIAEFHTLLITMFDDDFEIGKTLTTSKIIYFCDTHFDQRKCVMEVNLCHSCLDRIGGLQRERMANRLKAYRVYYSKIPHHKRSVASEESH